MIGCINRADKNSNLTLVTIIMLLQLYHSILRTVDTKLTFGY